MKWSLILTAFSLSIIMASCNSRQYDSPTEVYGVLRSAISKRDWKTACKLMTDHCQNEVVLGLYCILGTVAQEWEQDTALPNCHKQAVTSLNGAQIERGKLAETLGNIILDKPSFVEEAINWLEDCNSCDVVAHIFASFLGSIEVIQVDGTSAVASVSWSVKSKSFTQEIQFRNVSGSWRLHSLPRLPGQSLDGGWIKGLWVMRGGKLVEVNFEMASGGIILVE